MKQFIGYLIIALAYVLLLDFIYIWQKGNSAALVGVYYFSVVFAMILLTVFGNIVNNKKA